MKRPARVPVEGLQAGVGPLPAAAAHYVARVLRRERGDTLTLFDPRSGVEADATITAIDGASVDVAIEALREAAGQGRAVTLVQAIGKGDKLDAVIRDATELGVSRVIPVLTARTVVQPGARAAARVERWRRIAAEAARQSGRAQAPEVDDICALRDIERAVQADLRLALAPAAALPAGPLLLGESGSVALAVGPEGGLDDDEIARLEAAGWLAASLGPTVLRTETVAAAVLGALLLSAAR